MGAFIPLPEKRFIFRILVEIERSYHALSQEKIFNQDVA
jgi:hypothetical protein